VRLQKWLFRRFERAVNGGNFGYFRQAALPEEEAHSLAMLLRDELPDLASWETSILGIDVNVSMLAKASRARYHAWALRDTSAGLRAKYFRKEGTDFLLDNGIRSMVRFEDRNLIEEDPLFWQRNAFDVVFCRNVTM